jgi:hypothetical protein
MRNITVTIPDDSYTRARVWAANRNTSVSAVVRFLLETLPGINSVGKAFPVHNPNLINTNPAPNPMPESIPPDSNNSLAVFGGETVEPRLKNLESVASKEPPHGNTNNSFL